MWRAGQSSETAFTLLEVLIVLMILSLVATAGTVAVPNTRERIRLAQADAWLDNMLADLRRQARRQGRSHWVEFDGKTSRYRRMDAAWRPLPSGVTWSFEPHERTNGAKPVVFFLPDGTGSGALIHMSAGASSSARRVEWITGMSHYARFK